MTRFSRPVIISSTAADWPARPIMRRTAIASRTTSCPSTRSVPRSGSISVATMRMKVVFPAPLGPRMATGWPGGRVRVRSARAWTFPNFLARPSASMRACMGAPPFVVGWCCVLPSPLDGGRLRFGVLPRAKVSRGSGSWSSRPGVRVFPHAAPGRLLLGEFEVEVHLLGVELVGLEQAPEVESLEGARRHFVGEGGDELLLGFELALLVLRLEPEDARQAGVAGCLLAPRRATILTVRASARRRSAARASSGSSAGRKDNPAMKAGYSLAGVPMSSVSQSVISVAPASVIS